MMTEQQKFLSGELAHRLAAIDIGSNSIRLVVAEALRGGKYRTLDDERETTRLSRNLHAQQRLDDEAMTLSVSALRRFQQIAEGFQVQELRTIATCAVREAKNGAEFCRRIKEELGIDVEVISPYKEAQLAFYSVQRAFDLTGKNIALADLGGGSTEIVLASAKMIEAVYSTDLGAVRMSEIYGSAQTMTAEDYARLVQGIDSRLKQNVKKWDLWPHVLIGSGGTFTSLASMMRDKKGQADLPASGYQVTRAELTHLLDHLRQLSPKARRNAPGLNPDRADIIVAGLTIIDRTMNRFKLNQLIVHSGGVRDGLLLSMIAQPSAGQGDVAADRDEAIDRMAAACGPEIEHGKHVARLATRLFGQLHAAAEIPETDRLLLDAAARLQDVGYHINYNRHHKHSYHLILNSELPGFDSQELELIANVARYHRGSRPKKKHDNFRQLSEELRRRVCFLSALLRIAGGLDRSHSGMVSDVTAQLRPEVVELLVHADRYPDVDIWGARRRVELIERFFNRPVSIEWAGGAEPQADGEAAKVSSPEDASAASEENGSSFEPNASSSSRQDQ